MGMENVEQGNKNTEKNKMIKRRAQKKYEGPQKLQTTVHTIQNIQVDT